MPLFFGRTSCDLQVPYKLDPNPWKQHQNWLAIERWATYLTRNCLPTGSGSCLTATSADYTFDPTAGGGSAGNTSRWAPKADMNLTKLEVRSLNPPSGDDFVVNLYDETGPSTLATVTLSDGVDSEDVWTGTVPVTTAMRLWFEAASSASVDLLCVQAWFDGPGGGGLILYPVGGV